MAQEKLAQMNLHKECEEDFLRHPLHLSAMIQKWRCMDVDSNSDECFDLREADHRGSESDLDLDSDSDSKALEAAKPKAKVHISCSTKLLVFHNSSFSSLRVKNVSRVQLVRNL